MSRSSRMYDEDNRPKWLLELENRRWKPQLAHEVGAGAPCFKCDVVCPGLDLHFWRKICKNCKCSRDDHDVSDDDFPQFDLLLGPSEKSKRNCIVLKMNKQKMDEEETFEWAPPDTTKELAADYMKALPEEKLPIRGSAGAALRRQQLQKQLPLHDIDHDMCDMLSDSERKQFQKYLEELKKYVGQGKVSKMVSVLPFDRQLMIPASASECSTPRCNPSSLTNQPIINLRTPSSFVSKSDGPSTSRLLPQREEQLSNVIDSNAFIIDSTVKSSELDDILTSHSKRSVNNPIGLPRYRHVLDNMSNNGKSVIKSTNSLSHIHYYMTNSLSSDELSDDKWSGVTNGNMKDAEQTEIVDKNATYGRIIEACQLRVLEEVATPTTDKNNDSEPDSVKFNPYVDNCRHTNNLLCSSNLRRREDIVSEQSIMEENLRNMSIKLNILKCSVPYGQSKHLWNSTLIANKKVTDALLLPNNIHNADIIGSTLDVKKLSTIRDKLTEKYTAGGETDRSVNHQGRNSPPMSQDLTRNNIQDHNHVPSKNLTNSDVNSMSTQMHMHCHENPQDTIIRSQRMGNSIFPNEIVGTSSMCIDSLESVIGDSSIDQSKKIKMKKCHECGEMIRAGDVVVTAEKAIDVAWHPGCFVCSACHELLVDLVYFYYKGKLHCARDLADLMEIPRCFACDELIFVREYTVAEGHNYHVKHFCCWDCDVPLAGKQYISENDRPLCLLCYQKTYAKLCCACEKMIAPDQQGVAVKNLNFHATDQCFCCYNCNLSLLNGKIAIKENKPFCSKECIIMYVNRNMSTNL